MYRIATEFELTLEALCTQMLPWPKLKVLVLLNSPHAGKLRENAGGKPEPVKYLNPTTLNRKIGGCTRKPPSVSLQLLS